MKRFGNRETWRRDAERRVDELLCSIEHAESPWDILTNRERLRYEKAIRIVKNEILDVIADAHEDGQWLARALARDAAADVCERGGGTALEVIDAITRQGAYRIAGKSHLTDFNKKRLGIK